MDESVVCDCSICFGQNNVISRRTRKRHITTYGIQGDNLQNSSELDVPEECASELSNHELAASDTFDNNGTFSFSEEEDESNMSLDTCQKDNIISDSDTENVNHSPLMSPNTSSSYEDSDDSLSCTDINEDSDEEAFCDENLEEVWSLHYNKDLYTSGIAVKKLKGSDLTVLQWLALNLYLFCNHPSMSKEAFSDMLRINQISNSANKDILPSSYYGVKKMVFPYIIKKKVFHLCINGCVVFRNSDKYTYEELTKCPVCMQDRYYTTSSKRLVAKKTFSYIPVGPRLARIYGEANLAQIVQAHIQRDESQSNKTEMWDIHDSPLWQELYSETGYFQGDRMGISFTLELDGVNPYHNIGVAYSMTPIMLTMLNLPRNVRNAFGNIMLCGIIPGQNRTETANLDPYVEILVDELIHLTKCRAYSEYHQAPVEVKIKLLLYVLDYPGMSKLFHIHGSGSLCGCHWCHLRGFHSPSLDKVIYLSNRSFLEKNDTLRLCVDKFYDKCEDKRTKPPVRTLEEEIDYRAAFENTKNKAQASSVATATGCKGSYPLSKLPGHNRIDESLPDACHTIKDFIQNVVHLITGKNINLKKVLEAESLSGREKFREKLPHQLQVQNGSEVQKNAERKGKRSRAQTKWKHSEIKSSACINHPCILSKEEITLANDRAEKIRVPTGFGLKPGRFITNTGCLKSHDWKQLGTQGVLKYCLRNTLGQTERQTLFNLLDCLRDVCAECHADDEISALEQRLNKALALLERDFPLHLQNITTHLLHHIIPGIRKYGPIYSTWMFVFERFNSWICRRALNMRFPEVSAIETYLLFDWCSFMVSSGKLPADLISNEHNRESQYEDAIDTDLERAIHSVDNKARIQNVKKTVQNKIHKYLCATCTECSFELYYYHTQIHQFTKREVTYSCSKKERLSAKTVSSIVFCENSRGSSETKIESRKFLSFGKIQYFVKHTDHNMNDLNNVTKFAYIGWYHDCKFDSESGLWFVEKFEEFKNYSVIPISEISKPLVTAIDENRLWVCNCGKIPFQI